MNTPVVESEAALIDEIAARRANAGPRSLIGIIGAPGSGKTTLAARLAGALPCTPAPAVMVPMDGFHLDDALLLAAGWLAVKGAPHTFDAHGLLSLLERIRHGRETVYAPLFDRTLELSRSAATSVPANASLVLIEGNYLLLDRPPWSKMRELFDLTVMLDVAEAELEQRLMARWRKHGFSEHECRRRVQENDLPNGRTVRGHSLDADVIYRQIH